MKSIRAVASFVVGGVLAVGATAVFVSCGNSSTASAENSSPHVAGKSKEDIGRYLVLIGGCNDCHTPGGLEGNLPPEAEWLTGSPLGFNGPWGTTYASNLRLKVLPYSTEELFVKTMKKRDAKPPMAWASLHAMTDADLGAIYVYMKSLGAAGRMMPDPVPPGVEPQGPYIVMAPPMIGKGGSSGATSQPGLK